MNFTGIEWVITAYTLIFASLMLLAGALADRFGRKRMLIGGLDLFALASFLCASAPSLPILIAGRALQGVGAAMQLSTGLATLSHSFSGDARSKWVFGQQWGFYINLLIGFATIALIIFVIEDSKDPDAVRIDLPGVVTFSAFLFLTTLALISRNHDGWESPQRRGMPPGAADA